MKSNLVSNTISNKSGIYLITLKNIDPISIYSGDKRRGHIATFVKKGNFKIGRAKNLRLRYKNHIRTFGRDNIDFEVLCESDDYVSMEKNLKEIFKPYRLISTKKRPLEWLEKIEYDQIMKLINTDF